MTAMRRFGAHSARFCVALLLGAFMTTGDANAQAINFPNGFTGTAGLTLNGSASVHGTSIQLTNGGSFEAGSVFSTSRLPVAAFSTDFEFQLTNANADGFAFVLQGNGPGALGSNGGGLGYGNPPEIGGTSITNSLAVAFDLHNNSGEGSNSVRLEIGGLTTSPGAVDLTPSGIDLHSGHLFQAHIAYDETNRIFNLTLTDKQTNAVFSNNIWSQFQTIALPTILSGSEAYVGFTGGTGANTAVQAIENWTFTSLPYTPVTLPVYQPYTRPMYPNGFAGVTAQALQLNGGAVINGSALQLTNGAMFGASSAYFVPQVQPHQVRSPADNYYIDFDFVVENGIGDGFTFTMQGENLGAVGPDGGGLGYGPSYYVGEFVGGSSCVTGSTVFVCPGGGIQNSMAIKFDLHNNLGEGVNSTGIYFDGLSPTVPAHSELNTRPSLIDLHSGHTFHARINSGGAAGDSTVILTITDLTVYHVYTTSFYIPYGGPVRSQIPTAAWAGFTAGTGATPSSIKILNFTWTLR